MTHQRFISHFGKRRLLESYSRPLNPQRRFFLLMGVGAFVASACSGAAHTPEPSSALPSTATQRIRHAFGETEAPVNPTRIAVLGYFTVEALMALGVQPMAAPRIIIDNLLHLPPTDVAIADIGNPREPSLEKIATLQPDLILTTKAFAQSATYPLLSQIAPTLVFDIDGRTEWQPLTRLCAEVLGKEAEAAHLQANYEAKLQVFKEQLSKDAHPIQVSVASFYTDRISTFGKETFIGTVLEAAGLSRPPKQTEEGNAQVSIERLSDIDADVLFVIKPQSQTELAADVRAALEQMKAHPLWTQLKAVQTKQVHEVDTYWFGVGYIAANMVLDDLLKYIVNIV